MQQANLERLDRFLRARGINAALLSSPWTTSWLIGYAPPVQTGTSPFEGGPALGWWLKGELAFPSERPRYVRFYRQYSAC